MGLADILLVMCVLVLSAPSSESGQLIIRHAYPENSTNLSYVELTCLNENTSLAVGAAFELNGTDIEGELNITDSEDGSIRFILTPEEEGFFTCSRNGSVSNNAIGLAAQPSTNYSGQSQLHQVELPNADSVVSTELQCDIQPGALRQRYSVEWRQMSFESYSVIENEGNFNLTLNVSSSLNGSQYQCEVTVNHDGSNIRDYDGVLITLVTVIEEIPTISNIAISLITASSSLLIFILIIISPTIIIQLFFIRHKKRKNIRIRPQLTVDEESSGSVNISPRFSNPTSVDTNRFLGKTTIQPHSAEQEHTLDDTHHRPDLNSDNISQLEEQVDIELLLKTATVTQIDPHSRVIKPLPAKASAATATAGQDLTIPIPSSEQNMDSVRHLKESMHEIPRARFAAAQSSQSSQGHETIYCRHEPVPNMEYQESRVASTPQEPQQSTKSAYEIFNTNIRPETPFLPPCDPHNTAQHIPSWLEPVATLTDCTSAGRSYYDEHNDFQLEIPDGAIALEQRVTIDIGVALYGPFLYPEDLRPVSPVFWACVRDQRNFRFLKPVKVTIPHFLKLENAKDVESLGMTFLKGDHEMTSQQVYQFQRAEGQVIIEPHKRNGVLQTSHFCYLCITSKKSKKSIRKAMFCIYAAIPHTMSPSEPAYVYFFVTFLLATCLETVRKQISLIPELREHKKKSQDFQFSKDTADPALEIVISQSPPAGWTVGLQFSKQILVSEIDFFVSGENMKDLLKLKEEEGMYPPRFCVVISCSPTASQSQARIEFRGATKELVFDTPLNPSLTSTSPTATSSCMTSTAASHSDETHTLPLNMSNFMNNVGSNMLSKWQSFGILVDIPLSNLETYPTHNPINCFARVFDSWQRSGSPEFSWETVINILESPLLGEMLLAENVREMITLHP